MEEQVSVATICPKCGNTVFATDNFCSNCGTVVKEETISLGKKIYIYLISFFLPPLGLVWTFKFLKKSPEFRKVGIIAAVLTIISIILTIWFSIGFINSVQQQLNQYQNLGL